MTSPSPVDMRDVHAERYASVRPPTHPTGQVGQQTQSFDTNTKTPDQSTLPASDNPDFLNTKVAQLESEFGTLRAVIGQLQSGRSFLRNKSRSGPTEVLARDVQLPALKDPNPSRHGSRTLPPPDLHFPMQVGSSLTLGTGRCLVKC